MSLSQYATTQFILKHWKTGASQIYIIQFLRKPILKIKIPGNQLWLTSIFKNLLALFAKNTQIS